MSRRKTTRKLGLRDVSTIMNNDTEEWDANEDIGDKECRDAVKTICTLFNHCGSIFKECRDVCNRLQSARVQDLRYHEAHESTSEK